MSHLPQKYVSYGSFKCFFPWCGFKQRNIQDKLISCLAVCKQPWSLVQTARTVYDCTGSLGQDCRYSPMAW